MIPSCLRNCCGCPSLVIGDDLEGNREHRNHGLEKSDFKSRKWNILLWRTLEEHLTMLIAGPWGSHQFWFRELWWLHHALSPGFSSGLSSKHTLWLVLLLWLLGQDNKAHLSPLSLYMYFIASSRYNLHIIKLTHYKCTIQWFLNKLTESYNYHHEPVSEVIHQIQNFPQAHL